MNLLPRHRRSRRGWGQKAAPSQLKCHQQLNNNKKPYVFSVSFSIFAHTTVYEYNRLILILTTRWPGPLQTKFLPSYLNVNPGEIQGFCPKS